MIRSHVGNKGIHYMLEGSKIFTRSGVRAAAVLPTALALAGAFALGGPLSTATAAAAPAAAKPLVNTHPAWASSSADRGAVAASSTVATTVYLAGQNPAALAAYAQAVSDPSNASYHQYLTPAQFTAAFGATPAQISAVEAWLRSSGLTVTGVNEHEITATGTAAANEKAYGTQLNTYAVAGTDYRAPATNAVVPASVAGAVLTVGGLDTMPLLMKPASLVGQVTTSAVPGLSKAPAQESKGADGALFLGPKPCSAYYGQVKDVTDPAFNGKKDNPYAVCGYTPSQLRGAYGVTASHLTGAGVTVAVVDAYGSPTILQDANQYAVNHGDKPFAKGQFTETVTPNQWIDQSTCGGGAAGWAPEESLDIEAVHAMAPGAKVHYFGANSCNDPELLAAFTTIVDTHAADLVSDSFGGVIYSTTGNEAPAVEAEYTQIFEQGAASASPPATAAPRSRPPAAVRRTPPPPRRPTSRPRTRWSPRSAATASRSTPATRSRASPPGAPTRRSSSGSR
jgi:subtilase family serine protease